MGSIRPNWLKHVPKASKNVFIDEKNYTDPENLKFDLFSSIFTILPIFWKPENRLKIEEIHEI